MDRRRRGMLCVGLGLGMLGVFNWFESAPPTILEALHVIGLPSAATAEQAAREMFAGNGPSKALRLRYRGEGAIEGMLGQKTVGWEVDVYRLPAEDDGLVPHVVHIDKDQGSTRGYPFDAIELGDSVTVCWMDQAGNVVRSITPPGAPPSELDPATFLFRLPDFSGQGRVRVVESSDGSLWQMESMGDPLGNADPVLVEVASDSVSQRVEQIDRHMRFCYDRESRVLLSVEISERGHWRRKRGESNNRLELVEVSEIPEDRVETMAVDIERWEDFHSWILNLAHDASAPPSRSPPPDLPSPDSASPDSASPGSSIPAASLISMMPLGTAQAALIPAVGGAPWRVDSGSATTQLVGSQSVARPRGESQKELYASLHRLPDRTSEAHDAMSDSVLRLGIASGVFSLQACRSQLLGERKCIAALHRLENLDWDSTDLTGVERSGADYLGKPLVIGFLCRGTPHATRTIRTLAELRRRFSEDELAVVAFATTYSRENAEAISHAIGPSVPVFHDLGLAERVNLFSIGKSTLLLLDGTGKPRFVHTWQPIDLVDEICDQIETIRALPRPKDNALQQISLVTP